MSDAEYIAIVQRAMIVSCVNAHIGQMSPDDLVTTLHRVFQRKKKVFVNMAAYVRREVEDRGHPLDQTLRDLSFFGPILFEFVGKNCGHPVKNHL